MNITIQARFINKETDKVHCFKHAVQAVMLEQADFEMELDDFSSHICEAPCVVCNPNYYEVDDDYDCCDDEEAKGAEILVDGKPLPRLPRARIPIHFGHAPPTEEQLEEITKEEVQTKGFSIKSKIKKGK